MTININNLNAKTQQVQQQQVQKQSTNTASANTKATQAQAGKDSVSFTPQAQKLKELQKNSSDDAPAVNQKKIDELKKAITSGEYKVNPEKLAASISNFEFNLI